MKNCFLLENLSTLLRSPHLGYVVPALWTCSPVKRGKYNYSPTPFVGHRNSLKWLI